MKKSFRFWPDFNSGIFVCSFCGSNKTVYTNEESVIAEENYNVILLNQNMFIFSKEKGDFILEFAEIVTPPQNMSINIDKIHWTEYSMYCDHCQEWTMNFDRYLIGEHLLEFLMLQVEEAKPRYEPVRFSKEGQPTLIGYYGDHIQWQELIKDFPSEDLSDIPLTTFSST